MPGHYCPHILDNVKTPRRMLKKAVSKAAADESTGGVASGYVEDTFEARTPLADFFSILLRAFLPGP
jgi:hypothetical protein